MAEFEQEQEDAAAAEAGGIGGRRGAPYMEDGETVDPAHEPLLEAGEGESEGFEQAEAELIDHASHGDQHSAGRILEDATPEEEGPGAPGAPGDEERSSEREEA